MLIKNTSKTNPRGITNAHGVVFTLAPGESRDVVMTEAQEARYRAKIANGDTLEMEGSGPADKAPAVKAPETKAKPKGGAKAKTEKAPTGDNSTKIPPEFEDKKPGAKVDPESKEGLQAEAQRLGITGWQNWGSSRLRREIAAKKQESK